MLKTRAKRLCWDIAFSNIDAPDAGHIHRGPVGQDGPIFFTLSGSRVTPRHGMREGEAIVSEGDPIRAGRVLRGPANAAFPDGAIRGQLHPWIRTALTSSIWSHVSPLAHSPA